VIFADDVQRLHQLSDQALAAIGLDREEVGAIRQRFTAQRPTAEAADCELQAAGLGAVPNGYLQLRADRGFPDRHDDWVVSGSKSRALIGALAASGPGSGP
jgi:hypothetical protein